MLRISVPISRRIQSTMVKGEYGQPLALDVLGDAFQLLNSDRVLAGRVWGSKIGASYEL